MLTCVVRVFFTILASIWLSSCGDTSNDELVEENESFDEKKIYKLNQYVGAHTCAECHQESHEKWLESHHYHAMELPNEDTVRADFNNSKFVNYGVTTRFFRENEKYLVETENQQGELEVFEVA